MNIPYRTRRTINRVGIVSLAILMALLIFWFCWIVYMERYVVYTQDGAVLDTSFNSNDIVGEVAMPPVSNQNVSIYFNEGADSIELGNALTQLDGYYVDQNALTTDIAGVWEDLEKLPAGTPVMIDLKGGYGSFFYSSHLSDAVHSQSISVASVDEMIQMMQQRGFYTIARVSAFRDYNYGLNHVPNGLYMTNRKGLWADSGGCYWLNPTDSSVLNWVASVVLEVKALGFNEVVLTDFCFPATDKILFSGDKDAAIQDAAKKLMSMCGTDTFTLSFAVSSAAFPLPEGRSRIYLENVGATEVAGKVSQYTGENPEIYLVFVASTNDTRYNDYSVLRPISVSDVLEAQKNERKDSE